MSTREASRAFHCFRFPLTDRERVGSLPVNRPDDLLALVLKHDQAERVAGTYGGLMKQLALGSLLVVMLTGAACHGEPDDSEKAVPSTTDATGLSGERLDRAIADPNIFILDVRRPDELAQLGTVDGYTNIPIEELGERLDELPRNRPILTA